MLIQDKKLPSTVEEERKNLYRSTKGKELLAGAAQLQREIQGIADKAMADSRKKRGTTGMDEKELANVMDNFSQHSHRPAIGQSSSRTSAAVARYVVKNGRLVCVHDPNKGQRSKLWKPLFPKK